MSAEPRRTLDAATAARFARTALSNIRREFPHKLDHVIAGDADLRVPRELHPAFHGSFDWHSSVHMHWLLARIRRRFPALPGRDEIDALLDHNLRTLAIDGEVAYLARSDSGAFERPYGWAWLLKLAAELHAADDDARRWSCALQPLASALSARFVEFLPRTHYPVRHGVHSNSAFALAFAIEYAEVSHDEALLLACTAKARQWFANDRNGPASWEPSGADFLSPVLMEAELMRRVLDRDRFAHWLSQFLEGFASAEPASLFEPVQVGDRRDGHLVHLDGLNLSRAWCFGGIAAVLPSGDARATIARAAADVHLAAGWRGLASEDFVGSHWLATFALLALEAA
ncbi:MAG TPA: DUF2891 domain-containing protein [Casimicrobiaceae bacterium]|nr:DUF2891 domain-containing protein [Casimicrobiaceae bacterium]